MCMCVDRETDRQVKVIYNFFLFSSVRLCVMQLLEAVEQSGQANPPPLLPRLAALASKCVQNILIILVQ